MIATLIAVILIVIVVVICAQTFFRYVVFQSLSWSEELSRFLFAILVSWGLCIGIKNDSLIRVDIVDKKFPPKIMKIMEILYALAGVFVCAVLVFYSKTQIDLGWTRQSDALQIPMAYIYIIMEAGYVFALLSAGLKVIQRVIACIDYWKGSAQGRDLAK